MKKALTKRFWAKVYENDSSFHYCSLCFLFLTFHFFHVTLLFFITSYSFLVIFFLISHSFLVMIFFFIKLSRSTLSLWLSFLSFFCLHFSLLPYDFTKKKISSHSLWKISSHFLKFSSLEKNETTQIFLWKESKLWEKLLCQKNPLYQQPKKLDLALF